MIDIKNTIGQKIDEIWAEYKNEDFCKYPPCSVEQIEFSDLIFIGINPSISPSERLRLDAKEDRSCEFYMNESDINKSHKYFKKFFEIAEKTNLSWTHVDLLYVRESKQKSVANLLKSTSGKDFIYRQLMLSKTILDETLSQDKPKIYIVNNALARDLLGMNRPPEYSEDQKHGMDYRFEWDDRIGTYRLGKHVFFFTSMLTGQRALDNGSFERLIWHINFIKKHF